MSRKNSRIETIVEIVCPNDIIGEWGPWQRKLFLLVAIIYIVAPFQNIGILFHAARMNYWCTEFNGQQLNISTMNRSKNEDCRIYGDGCTKWEYDRSIFEKTIISEFNLVCGHSWLASAAGSVYQIGYAVSSILSGIISDKYGRLLTLKLAVFFEILSGFNQALAVTIWHFLIARFFLGIAAFARFFTSYMLIIECFGTKRRAQVAVASETGWVVGYLLLPIVAYFAQNFRYLQLIVSSYQVLYFYLLWQLPESPRWQLTHGKLREAETVLTNAAKQKGKYSDNEIEQRVELLKQCIAKEEEEYKRARKQSILDLWREPKLLKNCVILYYVFSTIGFVSYGFTYNVGDLGGNLFINCFLYAVAEMCSSIFLYIMLAKFKRRLIIIGFMWCATICCFTIASSLWADGALTFRVAFGVIGKFCMTSTFHMLYVIASEIIPTTLRQTGVGSFSFSARFGSITAPFSWELSNITHPAITMVVFGTLAASNGIILFFIKETKDLEIPNTIAEAASRERK